MKKPLLVGLIVCILMQSIFCLGAAASENALAAGVKPDSPAKEIVTLQEALICVDLLPEGAADGVYSSTTIFAVAQFQEWINAQINKNILSVNGMADSQTYAYLMLAKNTGMHAQPAASNEGTAEAPANTASPMLTPSPTPTASPAPEQTKETVIEFKDTVIENAIREHLDIWDRSLTNLDLQKVTSLSISNSSIDSLYDLSYCTNIEYLDLMNCGLTEMPHLIGLQKLKEVDLSGNYIRSIPQFYRYQALEYLNLKGNPLYDISGLRVLNDSVYLDLADFDSNQGSSWNDEVRQVQALLIEKNYLYDHADGRYGAKTANAIRQLQADAGIEQTGGMNQETLRALIHLPARDFEPIQGIHTVIYNAYRDFDGKIHFRIKNTGNESLYGAAIAGQQLNGGLSPLGYLNGAKAGATNFSYFNWNWTESALASGKTQLCFVNGTDFDLLQNVEYGRLWCYFTIDESGNRFYHYDDSAAPKSTIVFPFFS